MAAEDFIRGVQGRIVHDGKTVSFMGGWSKNISPGIAETPSMGSSGPSRTYTKYNDFSGSFSGAYNFDADANDSTAQEEIEAQFVSGGSAAKATLKLIETTQSMYSGNVLITGITKNTPADGIQSWSADWVQADGPLKHTGGTAT